MAKTKEELNNLKVEIENLSKKLAELTPDEFAHVSGGGRMCPGGPNCNDCDYLDCKYNKKVSSED